jgi:PmbA protein
MTIALDAASVLERMDTVLSEPDSSEVELALLGGRCLLTRFADGEIHQNVDEERIIAHLRMVVGRNDMARVAAVRTTRLDAAALRSAGLRAIDMALAMEPTTGFPGLPSSTDSDRPLPPFHERQTAASGPAFRADQVALATEEARRLGYAAAGYYRITEGGFGTWGEPDVFAIGNNWGLRRCQIRTAVDLMVGITTPAGGTGWAVQWGTGRSQVDPVATGARAVAKARASENPRALASGTYKVLLEPPAVAELLQFLGPLFAGRAVAERRSVIASRLGGKVASDIVTLRTDPFHPQLGGRVFDDEGVPTQPLTLIDAGWQRDLCHGFTETMTAGARIAGRDPNGYSPLQPTSADAVPRYMVLEGGSGSVDDLQQRHPDCLRVTRLWYNRYVNPRDATITGMTRDGFFQMSGAEILHGIHNMRYTGSVLSMLEGTLDMSESVRIGDSLCPALVTENFHLVAG